MSEQSRYFKDFTKQEVRNIALYIGGIMMYKFGLETMNACMSGIFLNRAASLTSNTGTLWTVAQSLNLAGQCIGSLLIGPLVKRLTAARLLSSAILGFGLCMLFIPILEGATGGSIPGSDPNLKGSAIKSTWGTWTPYLIFIFFPLAGIFNGGVELMRRVIPAEIVGGDAVKLRRMDATVHICYEITGTTGALFAPYWISYFGWGYAVAIMPIAFVFSALSWNFLIPRADKIKALESYRARQEKRSVWGETKLAFYSFFHSIMVGVKLVCTQRALIWLIPAYAIALIHHRYLENTLFPFYTASELRNSNLQSILTGGSNFGELLGALMVLVFAKQVKTPIPFLRLDSILILVVWILPYVAVPEDTVRFAWMLAPAMSAISFGWASGDVSLAAYIQSRLAGLEAVDEYTSPLGAVMSFLYVTYLVGFFILNNVMGKVRDSWAPRPSKDLYIYIGGVMMTLAGAIVFASTFIPRGSWRFNPDPDTIRFDDRIDLANVQKDIDLDGNPDELSEEEKKQAKQFEELVPGA